MTKKKKGPKNVIQKWRCLGFGVAGIAAIISLIAPVVQYTYSSVVYTLNGFDFLTAGNVCAGSVHYGVQPASWVVLVTAVLMIAASALACLKKVNDKAASVVSLAAGVVMGAASILLSMKVEGVLSGAGAKRVGVLSGNYIVLVIAVLTVWLALYILHQAGILNNKFDLTAMGAAIIASVAVPFATYTFKKVSHPYSGFDMLTNKVINGDGVTTAVSMLPVIVLACAVLIIILSLIETKHKKLTGLALIFLATAVMACSIFMSNNSDEMLNGAMKITSSFWSLVPVAFGGLVFARALYLLYLERCLSALHLMTIPGLLYLLINNYIPMFGLVLAFKDIDFSQGIWNSPWCGLANFKYLFESGTLGLVLRNTLLYNVVFLILGLFTGMVVGIALFAVSNKFLQRFYQTTILLPQLISIIVVSYIVYAFLAPSTGFVNNTILGGVTTNWYTNKVLWPFLLTFINNWKQLGYNAIIFLSSIVGIDRSLYEAAMVDGCGPWKQITQITIPQLKPTIITLGLLQLGKVFYSDFGLFYQVTLGNGALYDVTSTIDVYVYQSLMVLNDISNSMAASAFQAVCGFILVMTVNWIVRKLDQDNALF